MNRYEITGTVIDLLEGRDIIFLGSRLHSDEVFDRVLDRLNEQEVTPDRVRRTNGAKSIEVGAGRLTFAHTLDALRGRSADVVLIGPKFQTPQVDLGAVMVEVALVTSPSRIASSVERISN